MANLSIDSIFSVDVEDWYHILDVAAAPELADWDSLPSRIENNFRRLLDILGEHDVKATCFFLGWAAERFPELVKLADKQGHEIASHGYSHKLVFAMTAGEFCDDAVRSRKILEDLIGGPVSGYRAAGFSVIDTVPWFFDKLIAAGYRYDSSVFPAPRGHGGMTIGRLAPYENTVGQQAIWEFPLTVVKLAGLRVCFFGGGYLRLFPYSIIKKMAARAAGEGRPVIYYIHPREIDPDQPRLPMNFYRKFKSYINLKSTESKIRRLFHDFKFTRFIDYLDRLESTEGTK